MKIAEIEQELLQDTVTEETIQAFKTALKRVPKNSRCQHCYTTAVAMKPCFYQQALALIEYGLELCGESWFDRTRSYHNMAILYEQNGDYYNALEAYKQAFLSVEKPQQKLYSSEYALHLMRMEMHVSNFQYTKNFQKYYNEAIQADSFSQAFLRNAFYKAIAELIIAQKNDDLKNMQKAYKTILEMLQPNYEGPLTALLKQKNYIETVGATKEVLSFLENWKTNT